MPEDHEVPDDLPAVLAEKLGFLRAGLGHVPHCFGCQHPRHLTARVGGLTLSAVLALNLGEVARFRAVAGGVPADAIIMYT